MRPRPFAAALGAILVAAGVLYLAAPRMIAAFIMLPADPTLATLRRGKPVSPARLDALIASRARALAWVSGDGQVRADLAFTRLERAVAGTRDRVPASAALRRASLTLRQALRDKPINPDAWRWLAAARLAAGDPRNAVAALKMSLFTGPYVTYLAIPRLRLALLLWPRLDGEDRALVHRQIRYSWWLSPDRLVELAARADSLSPFRNALAKSPKDIADFETRVKAIKAKPDR